MSDEDYAVWRNLQGEAADVMRMADEKRAAGQLAEWTLLTMRVISLQELAINFAKARMAKIGAPDPPPAG